MAGDSRGRCPQRRLGDSYLFVTHTLAHVYSLSRADDLLGGIWAVLAHCLIYLLIFPFHPWGLAVLIGIGSLVLMPIGRPEDVVTAAITTAVVMVVAALSPRNAWEQPLLRVADTVVGIAVGLGASWTTIRLTFGRDA